MKVIVAGGRDFEDFNYLESSLLDLFPGLEFEIVGGEAKGADSLGKRFAYKHKVGYHSFPADWKNLGRKAGPLRNIQMGDFADMLVAFWDGESRGTKHMIDYATKKGLEVVVLKY